MKYSIIISALNEESTIEKVSTGIYDLLNRLNLLNDSEILIIDDGSSDKTFQIIKRLNFVRAIKNKQNRGKGFSMRKASIIAKGKFIIFIDADGSHETKDLSKLIKVNSKLKNIKNPYLITGVRFKDNKHGTSVINAIGNNLYTYLAKFLWRKNLNDLTCGLRLIRKDWFLKLDLTASRYTIEVEMLANMLRLNGQIIQIPISGRERLFGNSGIRVLKEGIIIPITFVLASLNINKIISKLIGF